MTNRDRIRRIGKLIRIFSKLIFIVSMLACLFTVAVAAAFCALPPGALTVHGSTSVQAEVDPELFAGLWSKMISVDGYTGAEDGGVLLMDTGLSVDGQTASYTVTERQLGKTSAMSAAALFLLGAVFFFALRYGKELEKHGQPFDPDCVTALKVTSFATLIWSVGAYVLEGMSDQLVPAAAALGLDWGTRFGGGGVLVALLLLAAAFLCQYGPAAAAEKEADPATPAADVADVLDIDTRF